MTRTSTLAGMAALLATASVSTAQAQQACVTPQEAESLFLYVAPDLIRSTTALCASRLPATAYLPTNSARLTARYRGESTAAWPGARAALVKIVGPDAAPMLDSQFAGAMVSTIVAPLVSGVVKARDCGTIDRIVRQMDPLPPRNTAALLVTFAQLADRERVGSEGRALRLPLCPIPMTG